MNRVVDVFCRCTILFCLTNKQEDTFGHLLLVLLPMTKGQSIPIYFMQLLTLHY